MGIFDKLRSIFSVPARPAGDRYSYWFYVRCGSCGETLKGRADMRNELSLRDDAEGGFFVRKTLIGSGRCYRPIEIVLYFDHNRQLSGREIKGGEFIEAGDYQPH